MAKSGKSMERREAAITAIISYVCSSEGVINILVKIVWE